METRAEYMWRSYRQYNLKNSVGVEDEWFYGDSAIKKSVDEDDTVKLYMLFVLLLEARLNNSQTIDRMIKLYRDCETDMRIRNITDGKVAKLWSLLEVLPEVKNNELLKNYQEVLADMEIKVFTSQNGLADTHKVGLLHRLAKMKWSLIRKGMKTAKAGGMCCLRCKSNLYPNILLQCGHVYCKSCLGLWCIIGKILVPRGRIFIKCPYQHCKHLLTNTEIKQAVNSAMAYFYNDIHVETQVCTVCGSDSKHSLIKMACKDKANKTALYSCTKCAGNFIEEDRIYTNECECFCADCINSPALPIKIMANEFCAECGTEEGKFFHSTCGHTYCTDCALQIKDLSEGVYCCLNCKQRFEKVEADKPSYLLKQPSLNKPCPACQYKNLLSNPPSAIFSTCSNCGQKFCSECSAKKEPIKAHGPLYHRPSCSLHHVAEKMGKKVECVHCKSGKRCPAPEDLVNGNIPANEL